MFQLLIVLAIVSATLINAAHALTVDEIIALKRAGVGDETIRLLLERERASGAWKSADGWIIHSTEFRDSRSRREEHDRYQVPLLVYPRVFTKLRDGVRNPSPRE